jgi:hypothetical protein
LVQAYDLVTLESIQSLLGFFIKEVPSTVFGQGYPLDPRDCVSYTGPERITDGPMYGMALIHIPLGYGQGYDNIT